MCTYVLKKARRKHSRILDTVCVNPALLQEQRPLGKPVETGRGNE